MAGQQKDPRRSLTSDEPQCMDQLSRSPAEPAAPVAPATELLALIDGASCAAAARAAARQRGDAVAPPVARFHREGIEAVVERYGDGQPKRYTQAEQERILQEVRREPDGDHDTTAPWSRTTLQGALRISAMVPGAVC